MHSSPVKFSPVQFSMDIDSQSICMSDMSSDGGNICGSDFVIVEEKAPILKETQETQATRETQENQDTGFPRTVWHIVFSELCERFSYYGISGILTLFMTKEFEFTNGQAIASYMAFTSIAYFSPLLGGFISDSYWGKFKTIFYLSVCYTLGTFFLTASAHDHRIYMMFVGMLLIAIGTGGIKPCVSSFGADQLVGSTRENRMGSYFMLFYFSINVGSIGSFMAIPIVSERFGYAIAFLICAAMMCVSILVLFIPRKRYINAPLQGSVLTQIKDIVKCASKERRAQSGLPVKHTHWLDYAKKQFGEHPVEDVKAVGRIIPVFMTLPVFWTLYNQQNSTWVLQAEYMNRTFFGVELPTAAVQVLNPIFILILLPTFDRIVWPCFSKIGLSSTSLTKMAFGMIFSSFSYLLSAGIQYFVDHNPGSVHVSFQFPQIFIMSIAEILISVNGLEFSYSQAPSNMKSLITALYLLTNSIGSLIAIPFYAILSEQVSQPIIFLIFNGLMLLNFVIFMVVRSRYIYVLNPDLEAAKVVYQKHFKKLRDKKRKRQVEHSPLLTKRIMQSDGEIYRKNSFVK